ncbi:MAG: 1,2-phenylacetyl-CoA epoxidase subunit PaaD [Ferruginibacter sp.]
MNQGDTYINLTEKEKIWAVLQTVPDPEVPVLSVIDLGIIRDVIITSDAYSPCNGVKIVITPTYSGCPAMDAISFDIRLKLAEHGYKNIAITTLLSPAWTTDWISEAGKKKLKAYGIAPPHTKQIVCDTRLFAEAEAIQCPLCDSYHTKLISRFGSTPCKSLYQCNECQEPFDYFKCH